MKATTASFNTGDEKRIQEEARANSVRKKSLDDLNYITIPYDRLPFSLSSGSDTASAASSPNAEAASTAGDGGMGSGVHSINKDEVLREDEDSILKLAGSKIVNFTGISNTDLKAAYGAPNLALLTEYDQNFTTLVKGLDSWGEHLIGRGNTADARKVLEFAVECRTDLKSTYLNLADIYAEGFEFDKIDHIMEVAGELNSLMKEPILRALKEKCDLNKYVGKK
ncbi:MAG: hypothetical protein IK123_05660 [Lachnospiraceae bacterium]|nr:hypothetical protein [Lachnospiraceae bacterium]